MMLTATQFDQITENVNYMVEILDNDVQVEFRSENWYLLGFDGLLLELTNEDKEDVELRDVVSDDELVSLEVQVFSQYNLRLKERF